MVCAADLGRVKDERRRIAEANAIVVVFGITPRAQASRLQLGGGGQYDGRGSVRWQDAAATSGETCFAVVSSCHSYSADTRATRTAAHMQRARA